MTSSQSPVPSFQSPLILPRARIPPWLAGTDPLNPNDRLRILSLELFTSPGSDAATLTFTSNPARLYRIEQISNLTPGADTWTDSGPGIFLPDGAITSRVASSVAALRRFYRVRAVEPLAP